jgi:adenylate kinase
MICAAALAPVSPLRSEAEMRVICTGTSGTGRMSFLRDLTRISHERGQSLEIFDLREVMFQIASDVGEPVEEETILDMFPRALVLLRAAALEKIASVCEQAKRHQNWIINTHAVFRWKNTLISGFDPYYLNRLKPDLYLTVTAGVLSVREILREHPRWQHQSVEDLLVWREEEQFVTEEMARIQRKPQILLGRSTSLETLYRLVFEPRLRRVYLSYPMAHVEPGVERGLARFKRRLEEDLIVFDPADVNDFAVERGPFTSFGDGSAQLAEARDEGVAEAPGFTERELQHVSDQIVARDYKFIAQSEMVVVFYDIAVPSPGVISEMNYALHSGKRVYGVWLPETEPSPFFTRYCTRAFRSEDELFQHFRRYRITRPPAESRGASRALRAVPRTV